MAWTIGKCYRCGEPDGDWAACMFRVRRRSSWIVRLFRGRWARRWSWECDDCTSYWWAMRRRKLRLKAAAHAH